MSLPFAIDDLRLQFNDMAADALSSPVGTQAEAGSWYMGTDNGGLGVHVQWMATADAVAAPVAAWSIQNYHLKIYNVKEYGAIGNGIADDKTAIRNCLAACDAAGGGIVYFPYGTYAATKDAIQTYNLQNYNNIWLMGDGVRSVVRNIGSAGGGTWHLFTVNGDTDQIMFSDLLLDMVGMTNPDPADQHHCINISQTSVAPAGSVTENITVKDMTFGEFPGDGVFMISEPTRTMKDVIVCRNSFNMTNTRAGVVGQRGAQHIIIDGNYLRGSQDQLIDYEPSANGIKNYHQITDNLMDGVTSSTATFSVGSTTSEPGEGIIVDSNIIVNGGPNTINYNGARRSVLNNCIINDISLLSSLPTVQWRGLQDEVSMIENIVDHRSGTGLSHGMIQVTHDAGAVTQRVMICGNIVAESSSNNGPIRVESNIDTKIDDNMVEYTGTTTASQSIYLRAIDTVGNRNSVSGNMLRTNNGGGIPVTSILFAASPLNYQNLVANNNLTYNIGATSGIRMDRASAAQFYLNQRMTSGNLIIGTVTKLIETPATHVGTAIDGNSSDPIHLLCASGGGLSPNSVNTAPVGSMYINDASGLTTAIIWPKEIGSGNTGWTSYTSTTLIFGATTIGAGGGSTTWMTPGFSVPTTTEWKFVMPRAGRLRTMQVVQTPGSGAGTVTYRCFINGVSSGLNAVLNFTATSGVGSGVSNVAEGDTVSIQIQKSVAPGIPPTNVFVTLGLI